MIRFKNGKQRKLQEIKDGVKQNLHIYKILGRL